MGRECSLRWDEGGIGERGEGEGPKDGVCQVGELSQREMGPDF